MHNASVPHTVCHGLLPAQKVLQEPLIWEGKGKNVKFTLEQATNTQRSGGSIVLLFL